MTTLGIDLAVRAPHIATLSDERGEVIWTKRRFSSHPKDLVAISRAAGDPAQLTVVIEPTRSAWVVVAAHFRATGAKVVMVAPERAADLREYYKKHTKNDRLDSMILSRIPLLHPEGLTQIDGLGPADPLKRAVRRRVRLLEAQLACRQRLDTMLDLLGPAYNEALGTRGTKTSYVILERYGNPRTLRRLGLSRLTTIVQRASRRHLGVDYARRLFAAAGEALELWRDGGLDFDELAWDLAQEVRLIGKLGEEIEALEERMEVLYQEADPKGIVRSAPGVASVLAAGITGRLGDATRFSNLAGVRKFSGLVPGVKQSGFTETRQGITKQGDPGLRRDLCMAADLARHQDPQLAAKYHRLIVERRLHHTSAICHLATTLLTRIAACVRSGQPYELRDVDGTVVSLEEARAIIAERYAIPPAARKRSRVPDTASEPTR